MIKILLQCDSCGNQILVTTASVDGARSSAATCGWSNVVNTLTSRSDYCERCTIGRRAGLEQDEIRRVAAGADRAAAIARRDQ